MAIERTRRILAAVVLVAALACVVSDVHPVFFEEPPELWEELADLRHALADDDPVCLPARTLHGVDRFAWRSYNGLLLVRFGRIGLALLAAALGVMTLDKRGWTPSGTRDSRIASL